MDRVCFLKDYFSPISIESDRSRERHLSGLGLGPPTTKPISRSLFSCISLYYYTSQGISSRLFIFSFSLFSFSSPWEVLPKSPPAPSKADLHDLLPTAHSNHSCVSKVTSYPFYIHTSTHWFPVSVTQSSVIANQYPSSRV